MKIKTSELTGAALDRAVVIALGYEIDEHECAVKDGVAEFNLDCFSPSEVWSQGGPIIDREHIHVGPHTYGPASVILNSWHAVIGFDPDGGEHLFEQDGDTPLIAAMRCYVASKLGDEVDVPEELC